MFLRDSRLGNKSEHVSIYFLARHIRPSERDTFAPRCESQIFIRARKLITNSNFIRRKNLQPSQVIHMNRIITNIKKLGSCVYMKLHGNLIWKSN